MSIDGFDSPASVEQLLSALDHAADAVEISDAYARLIYVNAAFERQTGFSKQEAIGRTPAQFLRSDREPAAFFQVISEAVGAGQPWSGQFTRRRKCGEHFPIEISISPVLDKDGKVEHIVAISRDITEARRAEVERKKLESQLIQSQKMEALGRLAGGIAHDFNNILMGILGLAQFTHEMLEEEHIARQDVADIITAVQSAADLTRPLLALGKSRSGAVETVELGTEVVRLAQVLRRTIREDVELHLDVDQDSWSVRANRSEIEQVLMNLIVNARDAVEGAGWIRIGLENRDLAESLEVISGTVTPGRYLVLSIRDNGSGIDPEVLPSIFEPFYTTKESGTGLGLATSWSVVRRYGGQLDVSSEPGEGTVFTLYLPAFMAESAARSPGGDLVTSLATTVLVAEDNPGVRHVVTRMLTSLGHEVRAYESAQDAFDVVLRGEWTPALLLSDVVMQTMSGVELARRLLTVLPGLRVLLMTGYSAEFLSSENSGDEFIHVLSKPFSSADLQAAMVECLQDEA